jgi:hypothetical protein
MYKCTLYDTTRFKAVMVINLSELRNWACFCESNPRIGDLLGSLVRGSQKRTILCHWGWVVTAGVPCVPATDVAIASCVLSLG